MGKISSILAKTMPAGFKETAASFSPKVNGAEEKEIFACLRLIRSENVGTVTFNHAIKLFGSAEKALEQLPEMARRGGRKKPIRICAVEEAAREWEQTTAYGATFLNRASAEYPSRLAVLEDAPPLLVVLGDKTLLGRDALALVGARNASANGFRFTEKLATALGEAGLVVTSGLARGIDTAAHRGGLAYGTIAVIAGGIDTIYPLENKALYQAIAEKGLIVAELPFKAVPRPEHFPQRNRIISGLSLGVVVVEASVRSGSLITARLAAEQGREVFAVPGFPMDPRAEGPNKLLKQGATLVETAQDILEALQFNRSVPRLPLSYESSEAALEESKIPVSFSQGETAALQNELMEKLGAAPVAVEDLISLTQAPVSLVQVVLMELELAGRLNRHIGGKVSLIS